MRPTGPLRLHSRVSNLPASLTKSTKHSGSGQRPSFSRRVSKPSCRPFRSGAMPDALTLRVIHRPPIATRQSAPIHEPWFPQAGRAHTVIAEANS